MTICIYIYIAELSIHTYSYLIHRDFLADDFLLLLGGSSEIDSELSGEEVPEKEPSLKVTPQLLADLGDSAERWCIMFT